MVHAYNYESGRGIIKSNDGGLSWELITGDQFKEAIITDVSVNHQDPSIVYVASQFGLFTSTDSGSSWTNLIVNSPGEAVRSVAVHPTDPNRLYAGLSGVGFYISDDGGSTWRQIYGGLEPNGDFRDIVFDLANPDTIYLADISSGVYRSLDRGESWSELTQGLTNRAATSLSLSSDSNHLYAATAGGGIYRLDLNGSPPSPTIKSQQEAGADDEDSSAPSEESNTEDMAEQTDPDQENPKLRTLPCLGGLAPLMFAGMFVILKQKINR